MLSMQLRAQNVSKERALLTKIKTAPDFTGAVFIIDDDTGDYLELH